MMPRDFEGANIKLMKPEGWRDEECMSYVPAMIGVDESGHSFIATAWYPSKEDLDALNSGRPIILKVLSKQTPPVSLFTIDENGNANL